MYDVTNDLDQRYSKERFADVVDIARTIHETRYTHATADTPLGEPEAGVRTYDHAIVLQLPTEPERGVLATFDRSVGRDLLEFIHECQNQVIDE